MFAVFGFITCMLAFGQDIQSKYFSMKLSDWGNVDLEKTKYNPMRFLEEADYYYKEINEFLFSKTPNDLKRKIAISIIPKGLKDTGSWATTSHVYINAATVDRNFPALAHEITHTILFSNSLESYSEGLADYFQNKLTPENKQFFYYKGNVHKKLKVYWTHYFDEEKINRLINGYLDNELYLESESLVNYLINRFGIEKLMEYFNGDGYKSYSEVFGVTEEELKNDWVKFVMEQDPDEYWSSNWDKIDSMFNK